MTTDSMKIFRCLLFFFVAFFPGLLAAPAQPPQSAGPSSSNSIKLDVLVAAKSGQPAVNLGQQDFTILDNKVPRPITSFKVVTAADEPVEVILLIDAVNTPYEMASYMRQGALKYLRANEGKLTFPTTFAVLTDQGVQVDNGFSTDGIALSDALEHHQIGLRTINGNAQWGWFDRQQICLNSFQQLLTSVSTLPGRKIILWVSPGWPLVTGPNIFLTSKQEQKVFSLIVYFSTQMREENVTLYNINPIGNQQSMTSADYYEDFLKGVTGPNKVRPGSLGVQVLATQSGGLAIVSDSDVAGNIQRCVNEAQSWYEIAFDPLPADKPNEYHHIEIKLDKPGLVARTRTGYYSNPVAMNLTR